MLIRKGLAPWSKGLNRATDPRLTGSAMANAGAAGLVPADRLTLERLLAEHGSTRAVAQAMGWGKSSVARWCRILGVSVPCSIHQLARRAEEMVASLLPGAEWVAEHDRAAAVDMTWRGVALDVKGARFLRGSNGTFSWGFTTHRKQTALCRVFVLVGVDASPPRLWVIPTSLVPLGRHTRIAIYDSPKCRWSAYAVTAEKLPEAVLAAAEGGRHAA